MIAQEREQCLNCDVRIEVGEDCAYLGDAWGWVHYPPCPKPPQARDESGDPEADR